MKRYKIIFILLVLSSLLFVSCGEESYIIPDPLNGRTEIKDSSLDVYIPSVTSTRITVSGIRIEDGKQVGQVKVTTTPPNGEVGILELQKILAQSFKNVLYTTSIAGIDISESGVGSAYDTYRLREFYYGFAAVNSYAFLLPGGGASDHKDLAVKFTFENCTFVE